MFTFPVNGKDGVGKTKEQKTKRVSICLWTVGCSCAADGCDKHCTLWLHWSAAWSLGRTEARKVHSIQRSSATTVSFQSIQPYNLRTIPAGLACRSPPVPPRTRAQICRWQRWQNTETMVFDDCRWSESKGGGLLEGREEREERVGGRGQVGPGVPDTVTRQWSGQTWPGRLLSSSGRPRCGPTVKRRGRKTGDDAWRRAAAAAHSLSLNHWSIVILIHTSTLCRSP